MNNENDFKSFGKNSIVWPLAKIAHPENISVGIETQIDDFCFLYATGKGIEIGNFCHVTAYSFLLANGLIKFNDFSAVGPRCTLLGATDDYKGDGFIGLKIFGDEFRNMEIGDIILEKHAHVGAGTIILPGVTIGEGCSVGAGSLVTKDLPEWTICVGSPCKPIKDKPKTKQLEMEKVFLEKYNNNQLKL